MEGTRADTLRALHAARRDAAVCSLDDTVDVALERARRGGFDVSIVVNDQRVVLGRIRIVFRADAEQHL
jgi:hypothetical protein